MPDMSALTGGTTQKGMQMGQDMWSMWAGAAEWGYEDEIVRYENSLTTKLDMTAEHFRHMKELTAGNQQEIYEIHRQIAAQVEAFEQQKRMSQAATAQNAVDNATFALQFFGQTNKAAFAAFKAVSIAETVINTYKAAVGAYSAMASIPFVGPALGAAAAAAAMAYGMAQVSAIASMQPGGGAVGTYSASPVTGMPTLPSATEKEQTPITIILKGDSSGESALIDYMMDKFNIAVTVRGGRLVSTEMQ